MYKIEHLSKSFDKGNIVANKDISFEIQEGEIFGFLGPNGAGKTTLIKQMIGLLKPDKGNIHFYDVDVLKNPQLLTSFVGYMPQKIGALRDLSVKEALEITGKLKGCKSGEVKKEVASLIEEFGLKKVEKSLLKNLSGGQSRLVAFCTCLIGNPRIIFLDEPTNDIDPVIRKLIWEKILYVNKQQRVTVVLVTHNVIEAEKILEKVAVINDAQIQYIGTVNDFKHMVSYELKATIEFSNDFENIQEICHRTDYDFHFIDNHQCSVFVKNEAELRTIMDTILDKAGFNAIEKFNLSFPTLEDAYVSLFKKEGK